MKTEVVKLKRFNSKYEIIWEFDFQNCWYNVDDLWNIFYNNINITPKNYNKQLTFEVKLNDINNNKQRFKLHQIILQSFRPEWIKEWYSVDHIDRDRLNNSLLNLRWATRKTQYENRENSIHKYKKVKCIQNGIIFHSSKFAEISLGLTKNTVARVARWERKSTGWYIFIFA